MWLDYLHWFVCYRSIASDIMMRQMADTVKPLMQISAMDHSGVNDIYLHVLVWAVVSIVGRISRILSRCPEFVDSCLFRPLSWKLHPPIVSFWFRPFHSWFSLPLWACCIGHCHYTRWIWRLTFRACRYSRFRCLGVDNQHDLVRL